MLEKKNYKNGQQTYEIKGNTLTYFLKTGLIKAQGPYINEMMEGKWIFNREDGSLWTIGHFLHHQKHGEWTRYHQDGSIEKQQTFHLGKEIKK